MDDQPLTTRKKRWPRWAKAFLKALASGGVVLYAARCAKIHKVTAYDLRNADPDFAAAWEDALDSAADRAEREAWRRAIEGTKKPVYQGGELVGHVVEYSDTLLIFMLKASRPEKYRERHSLDSHVSGKIHHVGTYDPFERARQSAAALESLRAESAGGGNGDPQPVDPEHTDTPPA